MSLKNSWKVKKFYIGGIQNVKDQNFIDFLRYLLKIDPNERPTAEEALNHPWFKVQY